MHPEAMDWLSKTVSELDLSRTGHVLDLGGRDVNGSPRLLFPFAKYVVLDAIEADGVDVVADAADWMPNRQYDVVVCCEVFEHTPRWPQIVKTAAATLRPGGYALFTCATGPRAPHSAIDGWDLREGEYYRNVPPGALVAVMHDLLRAVQSSTHPRGDLYAHGVKR